VIAAKLTELAERREGGRVEERRPLLRAATDGALRKVNHLPIRSELQLDDLVEQPQRGVRRPESEAQAPRQRSVAPVDRVLDDVHAARRLHRGGYRARAPHQLVRAFRLVLMPKGRLAQPARLVGPAAHHRHAVRLEPCDRECRARHALDDRLPLTAYGRRERLEEEVVIEQVLRGVRCARVGLDAGVDLVDRRPAARDELRLQPVGAVLLA
jgi:hypothetical protein